MMFTAVNVMLSMYFNITWLVIIDLVAVFAGNYTLNMIINRHSLARRRSRLASPPASPPKDGSPKDTRKPQYQAQ